MQNIESINLNNKLCCLTTVWYEYSVFHQNLTRAMKLKSNTE